mmetsp:Transcript_42593/g.49127  ORF Transcript_42593/g.49127 Transcript_42593/m.49127 type:complete len:362 (-) Transcript_42593:106-1191(-)
MTIMVNNPVGEEKYDNDNEQKMECLFNTNTNNSRNKNSKVNSKDRSRSQSRSSPSSRGKRETTPSRRRSKSYDLLHDNNIDVDQQQEQYRQQTKRIIGLSLVGSEREKQKQLYENRKSRSKSESNVRLLNCNWRKKTSTSTGNNKQRISDLQLKIQQHLEASTTINVNDVDTIESAKQKVYEARIETHHVQEKCEKLMVQNVQLVIENAAYTTTVQELEKQCNEWKVRAKTAEREIRVVQNEIKIMSSVNQWEKKLSSKTTTVEHVVNNEERALAEAEFRTVFLPTDVVNLKDFDIKNTTQLVKDDDNDDYGDGDDNGSQLTLVCTNVSSKDDHDNGVTVPSLWEKSLQGLFAHMTGTKLE